MRRRLPAARPAALYALSLLIVFLCLAALYESWSVPIAVLLVVPLGVVGALLAAHLTGLDNDIYFQVGLITTIGVSAKNAILIVEFAEERLKMGMSAAEAALAAGQAAAAADPDDLVRLHLRRAAAGAGRPAPARAARTRSAAASSAACCRPRSWRSSSCRCSSSS